jgi:Domain of unknown function (DUF4258)
MNAELSAHAQEELELRNIPVQLVQRVLDHPDQIVEVNELKVYQSKFLATNGKTYLLRVFVNDRVTPAKVVTVYRTSKINKYWRAE